MLTFITIVHILVAIILILLVLIQDSKGGGMGGMLGGGSNSLLGATGATSFIVKLTRGVAILFAGLCIALTIMSTQRSDSVVDKLGVGAAAPSVESSTDSEPINGTPPEGEAATTDTAPTNGENSEGSAAKEGDK